jgi:RNA polymerase sigma factor (sigma-70 family)
MPDDRLMRAFMRHQSEFLGYSIAILRSVELAEEALQDAAVAVMEHPDPASVVDARAWVKEVVRRQALRHRELQQRQRGAGLASELAEALGQALIDDAMDDDHSRTRAAALRACVQSLPERSRRLIELRYGAAADFAAIAGELRTTAAGVQRAMSRLRRLLYECVRGRVADEVAE